MTDLGAKRAQRGSESERERQYQGETTPYKERKKKVSRRPGKSDPVDGLLVCVSSRPFSRTPGC